MNKLLGMQAFVKVADSGSFTAAATQLGVSVSAVAKAVARLEEELGTQLLTRSTRKLALNDDGRDYYVRCQQILNDIEDAEASLKSAGETPKGQLKLSFPALFGRISFLPRVAEFNRRYPDIVLNVSFDDRQVDLIERGLDLAVQVGEINNPRYVSRVINRGLRITAASPAYFKQHGKPETPEELTRHRCVTSALFPIWPYNVKGKRIEVAVRGPLTVTGGEAAREAALLGLGIIQANWWTAHQDIADGNLVEVLKAYAVEGQPISVVYPPTRHVPRKLRVMIDFLVEITRVVEAEAVPARLRK
ncbi:MAG: LysR family transcriptional regulator [Betaproteobacteria bacterium]|nr:LysR family transcriptional regulator [Betaproteobacteria bacterium]